ncbi:MAG: polysaccharide deacetylase family protein, partial [Bryobacteraceae bacterium]
MRWPSLPSLISILLLAACPAAAQKRIAITIDDLPYAGVSRTLDTARSANQRMLSALKDAKAPAIGFVNEKWVQVQGERDARTAILDQWLDAGLLLGNHTFSHADLQTMDLAAYEDEVIHGEVITRERMRASGHSRFYFRFPFNHTGGTTEKRAAFGQFLESRGYTLAPFTVEHSDYWFDALYETLLARGDPDQAEKVRLAYLDYLPVVLDYFEKLSHSYFGRDISQIFLIHVNEINARSLPA